jgi:two-component sensor histidine kinase
MKTCYCHGMRKNRPSKTSPSELLPSVARLAVRHETDPRILSSLEQVVSLLQATPRADEALTDAAARLEAVAHMHALLAKMQNGGRRTVALDDYLNALADRLVDGTSDKSRTVLLVNVDPIQVPARVAAMFGQVVNELVTAVRHAFTAGLPSTIQVDCGTDADGTIVLRVSDDGKGYIEGSVSVRLGHSVRRS